MGPSWILLYLNDIVQVDYRFWVIFLCNLPEKEKENLNDIVSFVLYV